MSYAEGTSVPIDRSKTEIERILTKYGADQYSSGWAEGRAVIMFRMKDRFIRIDMPLPINGKAKNKKGHILSKSSVESEIRRRWRCMVLYVKAKLESVESEIVTFEDAFMAHIVLPDRQTVSQFMSQQIAEAYTSGAMPKQLLLGSGG